MTMHVTPTSLVLLRARFAELFGNPPPPRMRAAMLAAAIAWKEQVLVHGDIEAALARDLAIIADEARRRRQPAVTKGAAAAQPAPNASTTAPPVGVSPPPLPPATAQLRPGARLVRAYAGVTHVVEVTADGFVHDGLLYGSLSAVAKAITGTHWNGLLFFGLRRRRTAGGSTSARRRRAAGGGQVAAHG